MQQFFKKNNLNDNRSKFANILINQKYVFLKYLTKFHNSKRIPLYLTITIKSLNKSCKIENFGL